MNLKSFFMQRGGCEAERGHLRQDEPDAVSEVVKHDPCCGMRE